MDKEIQPFYTKIGEVFRKRRSPERRKEIARKASITRWNNLKNVATQ